MTFWAFYATIHIERHFGGCFRLVILILATVESNELLSFFVLFFFSFILNTPFWFGFMTAASLCDGGSCCYFYFTSTKRLCLLTFSIKLCGQEYFTRRLSYTHLSIFRYVHIDFLAIYHLCIFFVSYQIGHE